LLPGHILASHNWVAPNILILRNQHPITSGDLWNPLSVRRIPCKVIQMNFDASTYRAEHCRNLKTPYLVVEKKGQRCESRGVTRRGARTGWHSESPLQARSILLPKR